MKDKKYYIPEELNKLIGKETRFSDEFSHGKEIGIISKIEPIIDIFTHEQASKEDFCLVIKQGEKVRIRIIYSLRYLHYLISKVEKGEKLETN